MSSQRLVPILAVAGVGYYMWPRGPHAVPNTPSHQVNSGKEVGYSSDKKSATNDEIAQGQAQGKYQTTKGKYGETIKVDTSNVPTEKGGRPVTAMDERDKKA